MKLRVENAPQPPPPKTYTLTFNEDEIRALAQLVAQNDGGVWGFRRGLTHALAKAGIVYAVYQDYSQANCFREE